MESKETLQERYGRHIKLEDIGQAGQDKLSKAKVLVIGIGGLGSPVCMYLAAAGIGRIGILDYDTIEIGNLQRQVIHTTSDVNKSKVASAKAKMNDINPNVKIDDYFDRITQNNAAELIHNYDFVIDATDNFSTKFLVNNACVASNTPFSHAGVLRHRGQTMTIIPHKSACFACVFDDNYSKEMNELFHTGPLGVTPGIIGAIQASEAIKYFLGIGELLTNTLLTFDVLNTDFNKIALEKNPHCPVCGEAKEDSNPSEDSNTTQDSNNEDSKNQVDIDSNLIESVSDNIA